jgi:hypothetical protein
MKPRKIMVLGVIFAIAVLAFIAGQLIQSSIGIAYWGKAIEDAQRRRVLLLCNTDHQALLKAGREILSKIPKDRLNPQSDGRIFLGFFNVPKGIQIPQAIKDLKSGYVVDYDGYLLMEMHGGMDHFGVKIYPEGFKKPRDYFEYGDRELLPGLWYYDEGYINNPEYDKRIDALIKEHSILEN